MTDLLVDLGGTHCRVGLGDETGLIPDTVASLRNADFRDLATLLQSYLSAQRPGPLRALCAGVAGPVRGRTAQLTNHAWHIEADALAKATGAEAVHLINDLQAQGYALDTLAPGTLTPLRPGTADPDGARLVLGIGTGCNVAVVHRMGNGLIVPPAETGHTPLPDCPDLRPLYDALRADLPHLPIEAALSGPGLTRLHHWLTGERLTPQEIIAKGPSETFALYSRILGEVTGPLCLHHMATGGLFLIGGMARAMAPHIIWDLFTPAFTARGPYTEIVTDIPITLITDDTAALRGCARYLGQ
ncbi:glucokinase [Roseovarius sp. A21]|uniref:Glucokinase n=1 Tax=Roseovarius bejariae TaxID=2576383 RepID=A0A844CUL9_9RHOB|nr:glucokinase [Roseovarius bejariae]MRU14886.1 glucokinase [Roseovarius bejariae]